MTVSLPFAAAFQVGRPLFGNQWLALLAAVGCIALLLVAVALLGRLLAATHPAPAAKAAPTSVEPASTVITAASVIGSAPVITGEVPPEIVPVILAAMTAYIGARVRVAAIQRVSAPVPAVPSLEALMQQWSYEGRRQIYSSHKVR
jgi:hypothetical protein